MALLRDALPSVARGGRAGDHGSAGGDRRPRWDWAQPLRVPVFGAATAAVGLSNVAMYGTLLAVPVVLAGRPGWSAADAGVASGLFSTGRYAGSIVAALLLAALLGGGGSAHAGAFFALTALAAGGSALLALRLERGRPLLVLSHET